MLSSVAVVDLSSVEFCIMVTGESFCWSSIVGPDPLKKFLSSTEGSEAAIILLA